MALTYPNAAGYAVETFIPSGDLSGASDIISQTGTIVSGAGTIVYLQVLGIITASGKYTKHAPAAVDGSQNAVALACFAVDATSGDVVTKVYTAGEFAMDALTWNAATNTDALKLAVFPPTSAIKVRKLAYGAA